MAIVQWIVAAGTTLFVALIGFFQWRTAQQKSVLDLFDRRHAIYKIVRQSVSQMVSSSSGFTQQHEAVFLENMEIAYFFFGDDIHNYLKQLWDDIVDVRAADSELTAVFDTEPRKQIVDRRRAALTRISQFYNKGQPLFARYMRFSQTVPRSRIFT